jgi:hypothetical protein
VVTKKRLPIFYYQYDTEERDAGSTLAATIRGPNHGVHLSPTRHSQGRGQGNRGSAGDARRPRTCPRRNAKFVSSSAKTTLNFVCETGMDTVTLPSESVQRPVKWRSSGTVKSLDASEFSVNLMDTSTRGDRS